MDSHQLSQQTRYIFTTYFFITPTLVPITKWRDLFPGRPVVENFTILPYNPLSHIEKKEELEIDVYL